MVERCTVIRAEVKGSNPTYVQVSHVAAKIAIFRVRFLAVLCHVKVHSSRVHDHLKKPFADFTKFAILQKVSALLAILAFRCERS